MIDAITIALLKKYRGQSGDGKENVSDYKVIEQRTAANVWQINHNLNKYPSVTVIDSGNTVCYGDVNYVDENNIKITFSAPFSGKCILN